MDTDRKTCDFHLPFLITYDPFQRNDTLKPKAYKKGDQLSFYIVGRMITFDPK